MNVIDRITVADELAEMIYRNSDDVQTMQALAGQLSLSLNGHDMPAGPGPVPGPKDMIGIWKRQMRKGEVFYVRDPEMKEEYASYWARTPVIPPKGNKKRIVLLGESVARGYLYDPNYNCAQVLQGILDHSGQVETEIVDLARTNMDLAGLSDLTDDCLALRPDSLVIFAGNNWIPSLKAEFNSREMIDGGEIWKREGLAGLGQYLADKCKASILRYMEKLFDITRTGIPVVFLIPEFNLLDWKTTAGEKIPSALPNEDLRKWQQKKNAAEKALADRNWDEAIQRANELIALDISHPSGYDIAAEGSLQKGSDADARTYLESSRDTALFARSTSKPRTYGFIRDLLLENAEKYTVHLVDLAAVFKRSTGGRLPGRELFVDYCHLTERGIQLAMGAAAQMIIKLLTDKYISLDDLHAEKFQPGNDVRALACIAASAHNAHYGQSHDVLDHLCNVAAGCSPVAVEVMTGYADFASRRTCTTLCKSHEQLVENERIDQYGGGIGFMHKWGRKLMDVTLVDAIVRALQKKGIHIGEKVYDLRQREHGLGSRDKIDLTEPFYCSDSYAEFTGNTPEYFQARETASKFTLVADGSRSAVVRLVYRTPFRGSSADKMCIRVNGSHLMELAASTTWRSCTFIIPAAMLRDGINDIDIQWTTQFEFGENTRETQILGDYIFNRLYHVYGEISSFTVTAD